MKTLSHNNQSGRSMVEMLGVLAIIGVLSVGGISGYSKAMGKYKVIKAQDQIAMLVMNIRAAHATTAGYSGLDNARVISYGLAPAEMVSGTDKLYGAFGDEVTVAVCDSAANCASNRSDIGYFRITMPGLGKETCRTLATADWGADGLGAIVISGTTKKPHYGGQTGASGFPITLDTADDECNDSKNTITWVYY